MAPGLRPGRVPVAVWLLTAFALLLVGDAWLPDRAVLRGDAGGYFPSLYSFPGRGEWDARRGLGFPLLANPQQGAFYPPAWLLGLDYFRFLAPYLALHFVLAGTGVWLWLGRTHGALLAGLFYAGCGPAWSLATKLDKLPGYALLPWVMFGTQRIVAGDRGGVSLVAIAVAGTWLGGSTEGLVIAGIAAPFVAVAGGGRALARTAAGGLFGLGLAACSLVPFLAMVGETERGAGLPWAELTERSLDLIDAIGFIVPARPAGPDAPWFDGLYLSVVALALAGLGLRQTRAPLPPLLLGLLLAAGSATPLYRLVAALPVLSGTRFPEKWLMLTLPFVAALVAAGAERARPRAVLVGALVVDLLIGSRLSLPTQSIRESFPGSVAESIRAGWRGDGAPSLWDYGYHTLRRGDDGPLLPNLAALQGFDYVLGRQGYALNRPHQLVTHTKPLPPEAHVRVMRRTSADYWYGPPEIRSLSTLGLIPVREGHPTVLSDPLAWPFAALSTRIRLVDRGRDALDAVASGDPGSFVIRAEWPEGVPVPPDGDSPRIPVVCDRPRSDRVDCALPGLPGLARFATAWAPGWTATFDGGAARAAIPVDHALLGVIVPAGAKSLSLRYRAPGADLGLVVSVLCSSGLLLGWLRRRR